MTRKVSRHREPCMTKNALAIARWEGNRRSWLEGDFLGLYSERRDLQEMIGDGGTLWIVVSRPQSKGPRLYSLSFKLEGCRSKTTRIAGRFGKYGVIGDPNQSTLFASNDAKYLLLSLRFDPINPIDSEPDKDTSNRLYDLGKTIQTPRCLNVADVNLLENYGLDADKWSVFISYRHEDEIVASRLSNSLQRRGISVFRDKEALRGGQKWWPILQKAISRAKCLILVIGPNTHKSKCVCDELDYAEKVGVKIVPILENGDPANWERLEEIYTLDLTKVDWHQLIDQLVIVIR